MADSSRTIMTDAGFALETRVRADETKMQFTRATISTDDHFSDTDDALAKLTELSNIQQDGKVTAVQVINTTTVYVQVDVNQAESKADYQMRSAALYAKDDDGTEVLYGVTVLQDPVFVHKDADGSYLGFGINTTVGRASNVVVVVDPANMVTQQVFEGTMKNYYTKAEVDAKFVTDDDFASKLPKNIATTDAANTFAKSQTLAGGATDGAGNAIATTKDVSDGDATTLKAAKAYADTKISGKADDSKVVHTADMRKPANDVLGLEDIKSSPLPNGTDLYTLINTSGQPLSYHASTYASAQTMVNKPTTKLNAFKLNTASIGDKAGSNFNYTFLTLIDYSDGSIYEAFINTDGSGAINVAKPWYKVADDSKVVHSTDMRKPANQVASIDEVNAKQDKLDYTPANAANVVDRNPDTGVVSEPVDFTKLTVNGGKSVATSDDLKSLEASTWRPLTLANSTSGTILFKDNGDGTASLIGSANFTIAKGSTTLTPVIIPPTGYTFTSLKWSKGINNKGVYVTRNMTGVSSGTSYVFDTSLSNGDICFLGSYDDIYTVTFSPSELTTLNTAAACNPALVSISKV